MITQEDLAKKLGLTRTTVARALNGSKDIKAETKKRILDLAEKEGYQKNYLGSYLAGKGKKNIYALIVKSLNEEYAIQIKKGLKDIQKELEDFGFKIKILETDIKNIDEQIMSLKNILTKNIDGLIIAPLDKEKIKKILTPYLDKIKIVTIGETIENENLFIESGYYKSGRVAGNILSTLIKKNKKILIFDGGDDRISSKKYLEGFLSQIEFSLLKYKEPIFIENMLENKNKLKEYIDEDIDGIYLNRYAPEIIEYLKSENIINLKIVTNGFNKKIEKMLNNKDIIATVSEDFYEQGYYAGKNLFEILYKPNLKKPQNYTTKINILFKESLVKLGDLK
ncbi:LacI family DNA-binding transcriptional regulator [uncultured Cetobacterium sp.]|uniref:LacI family DNA-binding transcriptional regulator n=1 Tax=uncultured Cetobacterium sp. TaxID=527638 RepID=UPI00261CEE74|nr:LacI family DNA-binding transcriptional regulator [uncultured Cetobacterium sp.]